VARKVEQIDTTLARTRAREKPTPTSRMPSRAQSRAPL
jgi:hypothetical protein